MPLVQICTKFLCYLTTMAVRGLTVLYYTHVVLTSCTWTISIYPMLIQPKSCGYTGMAWRLTEEPWSVCTKHSVKLVSVVHLSISQCCNLLSQFSSSLDEYQLTTSDFDCSHFTALDKACRVSSCTLCVHKPHVVYKQWLKNYPNRHIHD